MNRAQRLVAAVACFLMASAFAWYNLVFLAGERSRYFRGFRPSRFFYGIAVPIALLAVAAIVLLVERTTPKELSKTPAQEPEDEEEPEPQMPSEPEERLDSGPAVEEVELDSESLAAMRTPTPPPLSRVIEPLGDVPVSTRERLVEWGTAGILGGGFVVALWLWQAKENWWPMPLYFALWCLSVLGLALGGAARLRRLPMIGTAIILTAFGLLLSLAQYLSDLFGDWLVPYLAVLALLIFAGVVVGLARLLLRRIRGSAAGRD